MAEFVTQGFMLSAFIRQEADRYQSLLEKFLFIPIAVKTDDQGPQTASLICQIGSKMGDYRNKS